MPHPDQPAIRVSALYEDRLARDLADFAPTHVVSLLDPDVREAIRPRFAEGPLLHQHLFHDREGSEPGLFDDAMATALAGFLHRWAEGVRGGAGSRLLVHCHMGASRSTAAAFAALAVWHGPVRAPEAFAHLLAITRKPWPNMLVTRRMDAVLGAQGGMVEALERYRADHPRRLPAYRRLNARRGLAV